MDLALATGRGEALLTRWPGIDGPLVIDEDAVQIGERDADDPGMPTATWKPRRSIGPRSKPFTFAA